jgi:hypothetical protein
MGRHFDFIDRTLTRFRASELTSMGLAAVALSHAAGGRWQVKADGHQDPNIRLLVKPLLNLFHGDKGGRRWKNAVDGALKDSRHR